MSYSRRSTPRPGPRSPPRACPAPRVPCFLAPLRRLVRVPPGGVHDGPSDGSGSRPWCAFSWPPWGGISAVRPPVTQTPRTRSTRAGQPSWGRPWLRPSRPRCLRARGSPACRPRRPRTPPQALPSRPLAQALRPNPRTVRALFTHNPRPMSKRASTTWAIRSRPTQPTTEGALPHSLRREHSASA